MKKQVMVVEGLVVTVKYPTIGKSVTVDCSKLDAAMQQAAMLHGVGQKLGDAASGKSPTEKFEMASRIVESLLAGSWNLESRDVDTSAVVVEAVARIKKLKVQQVQDVIDVLDEDAGEAKVKEWRSNDKVKAMIAKIRAEKLAKIAEESDADDIEV